MTERFFHIPDTSRSDEWRADVLHEWLEVYQQVQHAEGADIPLCEEDKRVLTRLAKDSGPETRKCAIECLCEVGPVTWNLLEEWLVDPDEDIRTTVLIGLGFSARALTELCSSDLDRCRTALAPALAPGGNSLSELSIAMSYYVHGTAHRFDRAWRGAGFLLNLGEPALNSVLICGYVEDVLVSHQLTLKDQRLLGWIEEGSVEQKMALLSVVQWFGASADWQREIARMLSKDQDQRVRTTAERLLEHSREVPDIQMREWANE